METVFQLFSCQYCLIIQLFFENIQKTDLLASEVQLADKATAWNILCFLR